jgi:PII-like signaling protein
MILTTSSGRPVITLTLDTSQNVDRTSEAYMEAISAIEAVVTMVKSHVAM